MTTNTITPLTRYLGHPAYPLPDLQTETAIHRNAQKNALSLFQTASQRIPAYQDFLKKHHLDPQTVRSPEDLVHVPPTSKEEYILTYPLKARCWDGDITRSHTVALSSGSTGESVFWPRDLKQEIDGAALHELLLETIFDIRHQKTLFINSLGIGNWIAGMYTQLCLYLNTLKGCPFTLASPGFSEPETFKVVKELSPHYDQTIIFCHPPVLKIMMENGTQQGINWKKLNVKFFGTGEGISENFRDYLLKLVGQTNPYTSLINIFGSADAGLMGFETPLTILLHRLTSTNHELNHALFHLDRHPSLYQYDPRFKYLESIEGELTITADATMPLIRYNIHDQADLLSYQDLIHTLLHHNLDLSTLLQDQKLQAFNWHLPFVYMFGRKHFVISLYAVNIYPENIKTALEHPNLQPYISGKFLATKECAPNHDQYLDLRIELRPDIKPSKNLKDNIRQAFIKTLKQINSEYNEVEKSKGDRMHPVVQLFRYQHPKYFPADKIKKMG